MMREVFATILSWALTAAFGAVAGVLATMFYLRAQEPPPTFRVLDLRRVVGTLQSDRSLDDAGRRARAQEIARALDRAVAAQAAKGVIVLDGSAVLRAPANAYVEP